MGHLAPPFRITILYHIIACGTTNLTRPYIHAKILVALEVAQMAKPIIMVVDDEKAFADELAKTIKLTGKYDVTVAYSAKDANETLKKNKGIFGIFKNKIRCILLDIKMP